MASKLAHLIYTQFMEDMEEKRKKPHLENDTYAAAQAKYFEKMLSDDQIFQFRHYQKLQEDCIKMDYEEAIDFTLNFVRDVLGTKKAEPPKMPTTIRFD